MSAIEKVNLLEKLGRIREQWKPRIAGELNGQQVKLVRFQGEFVWHHHEHEDELFLVVKGRFRMEFRDARSGWRRASSSSSPAGSSTGPSPRKRPRSCCSSRHRH